MNTDVYIFIPDNDRYWSMSEYSTTKKRKKYLIITIGGIVSILLMIWNVNKSTQQPVAYERHCIGSANRLSSTLGHHTTETPFANTMLYHDIDAFRSACGYYNAFQCDMRQFKIDDGRMYTWITEEGLERKENWSEFANQLRGYMKCIQ